jgi:hypothetical protein
MGCCASHHFSLLFLPSPANDQVSNNMISETRTQLGQERYHNNTHAYPLPVVHFADLLQYSNRHLSEYNSAFRIPRISKKTL